MDGKRISKCKLNLYHLVEGTQSQYVTSLNSRNTSENHNIEEDKYS